MEKITCYTNRELSWLSFNERVLDEAANPRVPLAERLSFMSIFQTNLDEFYMVRVGTLMTQMNSKEKIIENKTGMDSEEQVHKILKRTRELEKMKARTYEQLMGELEPHGIRIINFNKLSNEEGSLLEKYFDQHIAPFLSPMIIGKQHPFPFLNNKQLYAIVLMRTQKGKNKIGIVPGCRILYGLGDYKVHSKLCLITRTDEEKGYSYITQIGTGNYNEKTSRLYTDLSLITVNQEIGKEAAKVFDALQKGETVEETSVLLVAPKCLQNKIIGLIDEQIALANEGKESYIGIKMNSLTDKVLIEKFIEASQVGVKIDLIVRGICCLRPKVPGMTENITIISIVGRFLEHSRIYIFGAPSEQKIYISSADFMTRNTVRRVEVAVPIYDSAIKNRIWEMYRTMLMDDEKGKEQHQDGAYYSRKINEVPLDSQAFFCL